MSIRIIPFMSKCRGQEVDTGIDAIILAENGRERQIGVMGRKRDSPIQLFQDGLAPVIIAECQRAAAERDSADLPDEFANASRANLRAVQQPPPAIEDEEEDDDDEDDHES